MTSTEAPDLLFVKEVARAVRVSEMTIYRLIHNGTIAAIKVGKSYRIPRHEVEYWLEGNMTGVSS